MSGFIELDVLGLDVAVHDALIMGMGQCLGQIGDDSHGLPEPRRDGPALAEGRPGSRLQSDAWQGRTGRRHRRRRRPERCRGARVSRALALAEPALRELVSPNRSRAHDLECDDSIECGIMGPVDSSVSAFSQHAEHLISCHSGQSVRQGVRTLVIAGKLLQRSRGRKRVETPEGIEANARVVVQRVRHESRRDGPGVIPQDGAALERRSAARAAKNAARRIKSHSRKHPQSALGHRIWAIMMRLAAAQVGPVMSCQTGSGEDHSGWLNWWSGDSPGVPRATSNSHLARLSASWSRTITVSKAWRTSSLSCWAVLSCTTR